MTYVRDLAITIEKQESLLLHGDRPTLLQESAFLDEEGVFEVFDKIFEVKDDIDSNMNMQIALEEFCFAASEIAAAG